MKLSRDIRTTLIDYPKLIALELFTIGCNYFCSTCHAKSLLTENSITGEESIQLVKHYSNLDMVNGIVICGGEPTLYSDLPEFLKELRGFGKEIKLDTNGSNPTMLLKILEEKLADYVAMDVKGSRERYSGLTGDKVDLTNIQQSMVIVPKFSDYEFRTTIVPIANPISVSCRIKLKYNKEDLRWFRVKDALNMVGWVSEITGRNNHKHYLQKFVARSKEEMLDERFAKENLPQEYHETPKKLLEEISKAGKNIGYNFMVR